MLCIGCTGAGPDQCVNCITDYIKVEGICVVDPGPIPLDCGLYAYETENSLGEPICVCEDSTLIFDDSSKNCLTAEQWNELKGCELGTYFDTTENTCMPCQSQVENSALCNVCTSNSPEACLSCIDGYYQTIQADGRKVCLACLSGCQTCSSSSVCVECFAGYYIHNSICYSQCPSGTLGYEKSLYQLNPDLFDQATIDSKLFPTDSGPDIYSINPLLLDPPMISSLGVGIYNEPIFALDWEVSNGLLVYKGTSTLIRLQCVNC